MAKLSSYIPQVHTSKKDYASRLDAEKESKNRVLFDKYYFVNFHIFASKKKNENYDYYSNVSPFIVSYDKADIRQNKIEAIVDFFKVRKYSILLYALLAVVAPLVMSICFPQLMSILGYSLFIVAVGLMSVVNKDLTIGKVYSIRNFILFLRRDFTKLYYKDLYSRVNDEYDSVYEAYKWGFFHLVFDNENIEKLTAKDKQEYVNYVLSNQDGLEHFVETLDKKQKVLRNMQKLRNAKSDLLSDETSKILKKRYSKLSGKNDEINEILQEMMNDVNNDKAEKAELVATKAIIDTDENM